MLLVLLCFLFLCSFSLSYLGIFLYDMLCSYSFFFVDNLYQFIFVFFLDIIYGLLNNSIVLQLFSINTIFIFFDSALTSVNLVFSEFPSVNYWYTMYFYGFVEDALPIYFGSYVPKVLTRLNETTLTFYYVFNNSSLIQSVISIYNISPSFLLPYFFKIQCFCFEEQLLIPMEWLELPILFYIDSSYVNDFTNLSINSFLLTYTLFATTV